jgi:hypothetical protein
MKALVEDMRQLPLQNRQNPNTYLINYRLMNTKKQPGEISRPLAKLLRMLGIVIILLHQTNPILLSQYSL